MSRGRETRSTNSFGRILDQDPIQWQPMARMLPSQLDGSTASAAERKLFEMLKNDPQTKDWVVLHSLGLARRGHKPYGEVDFVVIVPMAGIFCLEVKGGRIACKGGEWSTTNRFGS